MMTFYTRGYAPTLGIPTIPTFKFEEKRPNAHGPTGSSSTSFFFGGIELLLLLFYMDVAEFAPYKFSFLHPKF